MNEKPTEIFITETEAAKLARCSLSKLRNDRSQGKGFPYHKLGRRVLYKQTDILAALEACRVEPQNSQASA